MANHHSGDSSSTSGESKRRRAITNAQRRAMRAWYFKPGTPKTQASASAWWQQTYGYYLNSSTVSEILSYKYNNLDVREPSHETSRLVDERKRHRNAKWADLEDELIRWVFSYESVAGEGSVTSSMLRQKATELWYQMPCYHNLRRPRWSECWRSRFTARYKLRLHSLLREATSCSSSSSTPTDSSTPPSRQISRIQSATTSTTTLAVSTADPCDLAQLISSWNVTSEADLWDPLLTPDLSSAMTDMFDFHGAYTQFHIPEP